ncbi:LOW QUALITY PROTEIN: hypothetical protein YC2023_024806 [Brassica napus]
MDIEYVTSSLSSCHIRNLILSINTSFSRDSGDTHLLEHEEPTVKRGGVESASNTTWWHNWRCFWNPSWVGLHFGMMNSIDYEESQGIEYNYMFKFDELIYSWIGKIKRFKEYERVATELKKAIMQACTEKKLTQSQLAQNGELVRKSSGNRSPKSIVEPAKYVEKPAKWGNQKVAPQNIHQPR